MNLWREHKCALLHYQDLLREAEQERLARLALEGSPKKLKVWRKGLSWFGSRLIAWGKQLQERYGTAVTGTTFIHRHSD